jgi:hypothetical protein
MVLFEIAIGMVSWYVYSSISRNRIKRTIFTTMQIISKLRDPYGEVSNILKLASDLPDGGIIINNNKEQWVPLTGDESISLNTSSTTTNNNISFKSTSNGWIVAYT